MLLRFEVWEEQAVIWAKSVPKDNTGLTNINQINLSNRGAYVKGERRDVEWRKRTGISIIHTLLLHLEEESLAKLDPCVCYTLHQPLLSPTAFENLKCKRSQRGGGKSNNRHGCLLRESFMYLAEEKKTRQ